MIKVTFLGTGTSQGVPIIACDCEVCCSENTKDKRLRSSVLVESSEVTFVIDTGPDFRQQMLREGIKKLDAVVFTHEHKDHTSGLDDIRAFNYKQNKDMPLYATKKVLEQIKTEFAYIFSEKRYPGIPQVELFEINKEKHFEIQGLLVMPIEVFHYNLPVLGFRIGDFTYITDANYIASEEMAKIYGSKVLVINALQKTEHVSHFTLDQAIDVAKRIGAEKTYFTHISHKMGLHDEVSQELPENMYFAYDGLQIEILA
ncbi:MAG: MBL fold metallo-hydrolase [Thermonemataceae bacterium]|nr:MBL fold metallo-hydrolase [Thermonemataceae bacterium]